jgi:exonuclease SbcD
MKFLHTADWHLGRRLHGQDLADEQSAALDDILRIAREHMVDAIIHAGDVFDSGSPPQAALKQYYRFLARVAESGCGTVIITGGNHDSPAALNAPKELLEALNIYVVGGTTDSLADEIIPIRNMSGRALGYCCAVPFLRDKDLRYSLAGESDTERQKRLIAGIREHYAQVVNAAKRINTENLPLIATGHLFVQGGITGDLDSKEHIHVGNLGQIGADAFPDGLAYVALGHLHRPQAVGKRHAPAYCPVRYAGSPIALDFSERDDTKHVVIVECLPDVPASVELVALPVYRRLVRFSGTVPDIEQSILRFETSAYELPTFVELHISADATPLPKDANEHLRAVAADAHGERMQILRVVQARVAGASAFSNATDVHLEELSRADVFEERLKKSGIEGDAAQELRRTFAELLTLVDEGAFEL